MQTLYSCSPHQSFYHALKPLHKLGVIISLPLNSGFVLNSAHLQSEFNPFERLTNTGNRSQLRSQSNRSIEWSVADQISIHRDQLGRPESRSMWWRFLKSIKERLFKRKAQKPNERETPAAMTEMVAVSTDAFLPGIWRNDTFRRRRVAN